MEGRDLWETDHQPPSLTSIRSDSGMNSMEYWDYTCTELELTELTDTGGESENEISKQMFTRNKELEEVIKFQRETLQDQAMRIEHLCRQSSMLREMTDSRLKMCEQLERDVTSLEEENKKLREGMSSDKARIQMLKLELEQCVQAIRDTELKHQDEDKMAGVRNDEVRNSMEKERKAVEERELLTELAMTRMTDKMKLLEEENMKTKWTMTEMENQIERLRQERGVEEELVVGLSQNSVHTTVGYSGSERSCQCHLMSGEPPVNHQDDDTQQEQEESREELITRLDTQYRELIDKYETLLDIVNQSRPSGEQTPPATPSALSLQEELGMLECGDLMNEVSNTCCQVEEAGMESDITVCSDSSGFCEGEESEGSEELSEVEKVCQAGNTLTLR